MRTYPTNGTKQVSRPLTPSRDREMLWHAVASAHQQRLLMIRLLEAIDAKLSALIDIALSKGGVP